MPEHLPADPSARRHPEPGPQGVRTLPAWTAPTAVPGAEAALAEGRPDPLTAALAAAEQNVHAGGGPFAAVITRAGLLVATGVNRVTRDLDPTAHAEVVAIRAACQALRRFSLTGCVLHTSCEPCPLCLSAALWARLERVEFAADRHDAANAGFDDAEFYDVLARDRSTWAMPVTQRRVPGSQVPFQRWLAHRDRTHY